MKWFNPIYLVVSLFIMFPFIVLGWIAAEVYMAFRAGFAWCRAYNAYASKDISKALNDILGG